MTIGSYVESLFNSIAQQLSNFNKKPASQANKFYNKFASNSEERQPQAATATESVENKPAQAVSSLETVAKVAQPGTTKSTTNSQKLSQELFFGMVRVHGENLVAIHKALKLHGVCVSYPTVVRAFYKNKESILAILVAKEISAGSANTPEMLREKLVAKFSADKAFSGRGRKHKASKQTMQKALENSNGTIKGIKQALAEMGVTLCVSTIRTMILKYDLDCKSRKMAYKYEQKRLNHTNETNPKHVNAIELLNAAQQVKANAAESQVRAMQGILQQKGYGVTVASLLCRVSRLRKKLGTDSKNWTPVAVIETYYKVLVTD